MTDLNTLFGDLMPESPLSIWKEDLSALKKHIDSLKKKANDFGKYLDENPSEIMK